MVQDPSQFDVLVMPNLYGDILRWVWLHPFKLKLICECPKTNCVLTVLIKYYKIRAFVISYQLNSNSSGGGISGYMLGGLVLHCFAQVALGSSSLTISSFFPFFRILLVGWANSVFYYVQPGRCFIIFTHFFFFFCNFWHNVDFQKSCKNGTKDSCVLSTHTHQMLTFYQTYIITLSLSLLLSASLPPSSSSFFPPLSLCLYRHTRDGDQMVLFF